MINRRVSKGWSLPYPRKRIINLPLRKVSRTPMRLLRQLLAYATGHDTFGKSHCLVACARDQIVCDIPRLRVLKLHDYKPEEVVNNCMDFRLTRLHFGLVLNASRFWIFNGFFKIKSEF